MDYNYTEDPYYASVVDTGLIVDGDQRFNLVIEKRLINEEPPHKTETTFYTYDIQGMSLAEVDDFTILKIQELNG
jgi:hypothetical protein